MPRTQNHVEVNNFVGGLVTDFHELNTPQNVSTDEDNVDLDRRGYRKRRLGIEFEEGYQLGDGPPRIDQATNYIKAHEWSSVGNNGDTNFLVVQVGAKLYFYDLGSNAISDARFQYSLDLSEHATLGNVDVSQKPIQVAGGKGVLFVVGELINPFYVSYDEGLGTFTTTNIDIRIRDLEEQDTETENDAQPSTLTKERRYDLYNQGWYIDGVVCGSRDDGKNPVTAKPLDFYFQTENKYPPKTKPWFIGKSVVQDGSEQFRPVQGYDLSYGGNTLAALGHYIVDPFNIDRSGVSGIPGFNKIVKTKRPKSVAFWAGRAFFAFENRIFYSQVITDTFSVVHKCYQEADPTGESISDLIDTDGGVIQIMEAGEIECLFPMQGALIVFAANGIWSVQGMSQAEGFTATSYSITPITSVPAVNFRTVINVEGLPCYWGYNGIWIITPEQGGLGINNIIDKKIQRFFDAIPSLSKTRATGRYDKVRKNIVWMWPSADFTSCKYACDKLLNYDSVLAAFYPYTIPNPDVNSSAPYIADVFEIKSMATGRVQTGVVDNAANDVVTEAGSSIYVWDKQQVVPNQDTGGVKYLTFVP